jgi:hypothetical protein
MLIDVKRGQSSPVTVGYVFAAAKPGPFTLELVELQTFRSTAPFSLEG